MGMKKGLLGLIRLGAIASSVLVIAVAIMFYVIPATAIDENSTIAETNDTLTEPTGANETFADPELQTDVANDTSSTEDTALNVSDDTLAAGDNSSLTDVNDSFVDNNNSSSTDSTNMDVINDTASADENSTLIASNDTLTNNDTLDDSTMNVTDDNSTQENETLVDDSMLNITDGMPADSDNSTIMVDNSTIPDSELNITDDTSVDNSTLENDTLVADSELNVTDELLVPANDTLATENLTLDDMPDIDDNSTLNSTNDSALNVTDYASKPVVLAEWVTNDENSTKPWTQVNPTMVFNTTKKIGYWMVVKGDSAAAYVDVYQPDGNLLHQLMLNEMYMNCDSEMAIANLTSAYNASLVILSEGYTLQNVIDELEQCTAKVYYAESDISYCQMCGEFVWSLDCTTDCKWTTDEFTHGYRVDGYAFNDGVKSQSLTDYFEYICQDGIELDFDGIQFGNLVLSMNNWVTGDSVFDSDVGPACAIIDEEGCRAPTVRNVGNIPVIVNVQYDDMSFGYTESSDRNVWNVQWGARLGSSPNSYMYPYESKQLDGNVPLCSTQKISFSLYLNKFTSPGHRSGSVTIDDSPDPSYPYQ
ncbi:MAG: hypothetical protein V1900_04120 [Candidatus Aenigmatarchaeota archaeon]